MESVNWDLLDKYFKHNPYSLVAHHLDSFNKFFSGDIYNIFREKENCSYWVNSWMSSKLCSVLVERNQLDSLRIGSKMNFM